MEFEECVTIGRREPDDEELEPIHPGGEDWRLTGTLDEEAATGQILTLWTWARGEAPSAPPPKVTEPPPQRPKRENTGRKRKVTDDQVREIRAAYAAGECDMTIAARYGITRSYVRNIATGRYRTDA